MLYEKLRGKTREKGRGGGEGNSKSQTRTESNKELLIAKIVKEGMTV